MRHPIARSSVAAAACIAALAARAQGQTCAATPAQTEGPYYRTPNPETQDMRRGTDGPAFTLRGQVVDTNCNPIPWTWVALWHADPSGAYDNVAPFDVYRATSFTDANGEFEFRTISPGLYPGRTRHAHIKVDAASTAMLTTQLYWPGEPQNSTDGLFSPALLMTVTAGSDGTPQGHYRFVIPVTGSCTGATITSSPASTSASPGGAANFTAVGAGSSPRTFRWYRNGVELRNDARISGATTGTLSIAGVSAADAGTYACLSANSCGSQLSAPATLTVEGACPADLDSDGGVGGTDLAALLAAWGPCGGCAADLNASGSVDGTDLASVLSAWGACPCPTVEIPKLKASLRKKRFTTRSKIIPITPIPKNDPIGERSF